MKRIIALHGNPGSPADWDILKSQLDTSNFEITAVENYDSAWKSEVMKGFDKKILIGHSWGAYCILKSLPEIAPFVERVILVAPYIKPESELSGLASLLLKLPGIGSVLIKGSHKKSKDSFLADLIFPNKVEDNKYFQTLREQLSDWRVWEKTVQFKLQMQSEPWSVADSLENIPITALFGEHDKITNAILQNTPLTHYPHVKIKIVNGTGHGLLWSQPNAILSELSPVATDSMKIL